MKYNSQRKLPKRLSKKFVRRNRRERTKFRKKKMIHGKEELFEDILPMLSPYNSNEYLMKNQSSPFYDEEDLEEDFLFQKTELMDLVNELKERKENDYPMNKMDSTCDESEIFNGQIGELAKELKENSIEIQKK